MVGSGEEGGATGRDQGERSCEGKRGVGAGEGVLLVGGGFEGQKRRGRRRGGAGKEEGQEKRR